MRAILITILIFFYQASIANENQLNMVLDQFGLGSIKIGMKPDEISKILGLDITKVKDQHTEQYCSTYSLEHNSIYGNNVTFLVNGGTLATIYVKTKKIKTDRGFTIGKTVKEAESLYKGMTTKGTTHYGELSLIVKFPRSDNLLKMVGSEKNIRFMELGREPEINFTEGCL